MIVKNVRLGAVEIHIRKLGHLLTCITVIALLKIKGWMTGMIATEHATESHSNNDEDYPV